MSLTGLNNVTPDVANMKDPLIPRIRALASELNTMFDQKNAEGSMDASNKTKTSSREAYRLSITASELNKGPVYAKPR